jgi:hypothetical protein
MQIGISLQNNWGVEEMQSLVQLARKAEEWGCASKTCVFTPSHETSIRMAYILPYAGSHDTRLGRESSWPQVPWGPHVFQAAEGQGSFLRPDR